MSTDVRFITAIGTPLTPDDDLHDAGLEAHLADQVAHGIHGILAAGSMGLMQLQTDEVYRRLARRSAELFKPHGEVLVGAGDTSFIRTRQRVEFLNTLDIDGIAVLAPYFSSFSQAELIDYYTALAAVARKPLYLYDVPQRTRCKLENQTVLTLAQNPRIVGIKCSDDFMHTRQLMDQAPRCFRVIVAQPDLIDMLIREGVRDHLDGMWAIAPQWTVQIARQTLDGQAQAARQAQMALSHLRQVMFEIGFYGSFTVLMNRRGLPGRYAPRPYRDLTPSQAEHLLGAPVVQRLLAGDPDASGLHVAQAGVA
jgi:4-hydroxy-tetrahydrodipicolinate synthase